MESAAIAFLKRMLDAPGPSGYEEAPARVWREEAAGFAGSVESDALGNSFARIGSESGPVVVIEGHIDEIGLLITHVDPEGFLWFDQVGGWDDQVLVGQRIRIANERGDVIGVIGRKARHLMKAEDREKAVETSDLWIDIGMTSRADAMSRVAIGDPCVVDAGFIQLTDDLVVSRSLDNRVGAFVALEALRLLVAEPPACQVVAVAAVQEEITFAGAYTSTFRLAPAVAIAIDVTHSTDYPGANKKSDDEVRVGGGPVLTRGAAVHPAVFAGLRTAGERLGLECPVQAAARSSGTDADAMIRSGAGTATGLVSIPNRYMHSPNEVVSLSDLDNAARLIAEYVRTIDVTTDFRR